MGEKKRKVDIQPGSSEVPRALFQQRKYTEFKISWDGGFGGHLGKEEGAHAVLIPELGRQLAGL